MPSSLQNYIEKEVFKINTIVTIILLAAAIGIGFAAGFILKRMFSERELKGAAEQAKRIIQEAEKEAEVKRKEVAIEAKDKLYQARMEFDKEAREKRNEINNL